MPQGIITKIVADRGFGFISGEQGEVFFHHSSVNGTAFDDLQQGQAVEYELDQTEDPRRRNKGPRAASVTPV